ncbi:MAG: hypothetical protein M3P18_02290 [Actinomycetota bacterium]|nr:hypothetical protein [Actinomycetota bacterium]
MKDDLKKMRQEVDRLLAERRPDRYAVAGSEADEVDENEVQNNEWLDGIAADVEHLAPEVAVRRILARSIVAQREGRATRRANDLLRQIHRSGQLVLDWMDAMAWPIAVVERVDRPSEKPKKLEERVALRATTARDLRAFAIEERRRAGTDHAARSDACSGAEWAADQIVQAGVVTFLDWARSVDIEDPPFDDSDGGDSP